MIRRPPRSTLDRSSAASDVYKRQVEYIEMPELLRNKYQYHTQADITRLRRAGYAAEVAQLDAAVAKYLQNYLATGKYLGDA